MISPEIGMEDYDGAEAIERAWRDGLKPDPLLTVSEWADRYRVLSQRASSEPGRWRTDADAVPASEVHGLRCRRDRHRASGSR